MTTSIGAPEKPAQCRSLEHEPIQYVDVKGHWKSLNEKNPIAGFPVSEIHCTKPGFQSWRREGRCTEEQANVIPIAGMVVTPEYDEYQIVSWTDDGLSARYVGGACNISHTLEINFTTGSVLAIDAPTEMDDKTKEVCGPFSESATYQLMDGEAFTIVPTKRTATTQ